MIYIRELFPDNKSVLIMVDGVLDEESVAVLEEVLIHHLKDKEKISVDLTRLLHISREGRRLIQEFKSRLHEISEKDV